ncbi:TetR/AcrR family transcriptional regulator [Acidimangrovimonas sediminis]|uniref:TetR/AcrR family transcriptional regulator n=1 Tax=Acidimangrovimonas sediminis TaxID=2056283 RepID=UPI0018EB1E39|nr:TetR/AcrR family transcriptional regulator [Acidimangrovimonas sediminis]
MSTSEHEDAMSDGTSRPLRADAQRNEEAILEAAKRVFATTGVDAPIREIAKEAGVGLATLYRRFPKRADLIAAIYRREIDACTAEAEQLSRDLPPREALQAWLIRYSEVIATKRGLATALHSGDPAFEGLPAYFRDKFEPTLQGLLDSAAAAGAMRKDIKAYDLLRAIGNLSVASGEGSLQHVQLMVGLLIDGLLQP